MTENNELPPGAVETHRVTVVAYIDADGESKYHVKTTGEAALTSYLGLLAAAQMHVYETIHDA